MQVVILAGGRASPEILAKSGVEQRALIQFRDRPMVDWVLDAVRHLGEPILVGPVVREGVRSVSAGDSFVASLSAGIAAVTDEHFLLCTADLPFLNAGAVDDFLQRSDLAVTINYPIVLVSDCESRFPGLRRTGLRLKEGTFTGGNIGLVKTETMRQLLPKLELAYAYRKSPLKLASLVGCRAIFQLAIGRLFPSTLTIAKLETTVSKMLGAPIKAVITPYAEIATDIDDAAQLEAAENLK